ncbi:hypothetical protein BJ912DRAFT_409245 [Pholiota molesta]|nr:hypothetical protein BJ912DRAFT_409245 [Pholiota molesta]
MRMRIRAPSPVVAPSTPALEPERVAGSDGFAGARAGGGGGGAAAWGWDDPWSGHRVAPAARAQNADVVIALELDARAETVVIHGHEAHAPPADGELEAYHASGGGDAGGGEGEGGAIVENSPAGLLSATVLDEDEDDARVPALDLEALDLAAFVPFEAPAPADGGAGAGERERADRGGFAPGVSGVDQEAQAQDDEEEEVTPTPTPASGHAELPPAALLHEIILADGQASDRTTEVFYPDPELAQLDDAWTPSPGFDHASSETHVRSREQQEEEALFPDPDLLPLPLAGAANNIESESESVRETLEEVRSQLRAIAGKGRPSTPPALSQTPTPPASPPPLLAVNTTTASAFRLRPANAKSRGASRVPSPTGTVSGAAMFAGADEDKENVGLTPTAVEKQQRPAWSLRASDAPALGLPSSGGAMGASPRTRRKALEDVNWGLNEEKEAVVVEEKREAEVEVVGVLEHIQNEENVEEKTHDEQEEEKEKDVPAADLAALSLEPSTSLPGAFPDASPPAIFISPPAASPSASTVSFPSTSPAKEPAPSTPTSTSTSTVVQRLRRASLSAQAWTMPSARTLVRSPLDIALAMQLRPGLGAGADPAWMVRFLMAVYGWLLVSVAGGDF